MRSQLHNRLVNKPFSTLRLTWKKYKKKNKTYFTNFYSFHHFIRQKITILFFFKISAIYLWRIWIENASLKKKKILKRDPLNHQIGINNFCSLELLITYYVWIYESSQQIIIKKTLLTEIMLDRMSNDRCTKQNKKKNEIINNQQQIWTDY